jgi:hypothetical protein
MGLKSLLHIVNRLSLTTILLIFILFVGFISCKNEGNDVSGTCLDCVSDKPDTSALSIKVTINGENPYVVLTIYKDKFNPARKDSAGYIERTDTARKSPYSIEVPVDQYYSVKAKYKSGQKIIYAIDGGIFQVQKQSGCDNTCWQMVGGRFDATLKFKK